MPVRGRINALSGEPSSSTQAPHSVQKDQNYIGFEGELVTRLAPPISSTVISLPLSDVNGRPLLETTRGSSHDHDQTVPVPNRTHATLAEIAEPLRKMAAGVTSAIPAETPQFARGGPKSHEYESILPNGLSRVMDEGGTLSTNPVLSGTTKSDGTAISVPPLPSSSPSSREPSEITTHQARVTSEARSEPKLTPETQHIASPVLQDWSRPTLPLLKRSTSHNHFPDTGNLQTKSSSETLHHRMSLSWVRATAASSRQKPEYRLTNNQPPRTRPPNGAADKTAKLLRTDEVKSSIGIADETSNSPSPKDTPSLGSRHGLTNKTNAPSFVSMLQQLREPRPQLIPPAANPLETRASSPPGSRTVATGPSSARSASYTPVKEAREPVSNSQSGVAHNSARPEVSVDHRPSVFSTNQEVVELSIDKGGTAWAVPKMPWMDEPLSIPGSERAKLPGVLNGLTTTGRTARLGQADRTPETYETAKSPVNSAVDLKSASSSFVPDEIVSKVEIPQHDVAKVDQHLSSLKTSSSDKDPAAFSDTSYEDIQPNVSPDALPASEASDVVARRSLEPEAPSTGVARDILRSEWQATKPSRSAPERAGGPRFRLDPTPKLRVSTSQPTTHSQTHLGSEPRTNQHAHSGRQRSELEIPSDRQLTDLKHKRDNDDLTEQSWVLPTSRPPEKAATHTAEPIEYSPNAGTTKSARHSDTTTLTHVLSGGIGNVASTDVGKTTESFPQHDAAQQPAMPGATPRLSRFDHPEPENLAALKVELEIGASVHANVRERSGVIEVRMVTNDSEAARRLTGEVDGLRHSLSVTGLKLERLEVNYQNDGRQQRLPNQQPDARRQKNLDEQAGIFTVGSSL
jgi:hypothetical protein